MKCPTALRDELATVSAVEVKRLGLIPLMDVATNAGLIHCHREKGEEGKIGERGRMKRGEKGKRVPKADS